MEQTVLPFCHPATKNYGGQPGSSLEKLNGSAKYLGFSYWHGAHPVYHPKGCLQVNATHTKQFIICYWLTLHIKRPLRTTKHSRIATDIKKTRIKKMTSEKIEIMKGTKTLNIHRRYLIHKTEQITMKNDQIRTHRNLKLDPNFEKSNIKKERWWRNLPK